MADQVTGGGEGGARSDQGTWGGGERRMLKS